MQMDQMSNEERAKLADRLDELLWNFSSSEHDVLPMIEKAIGFELSHKWLTRIGNSLLATAEARRSEMEKNDKARNERLASLGILGLVKQDLPELFE